MAESKILLAILSSVLLILSFPGFDIEFLAWIALVPLLFAIEKQKPGMAFLTSYFAGVLFFLGTMYWLIHVTLPGMIAVVLYLALYFGFFGMIVSCMLRSGRYETMFFIPAAWVVLEWTRSHLFTGFGWNLLAHSQAYTLPVIQIADIFGVYGVSFLIVIVNSAMFLTLKDFQKKKYSTIRIGIAIALVFLSVAYGVFRMKNIFTGEILRVAIVQGNIPQVQKWDPDYRESILDKYESLTKRAGKMNADLIIWPEASVPGFLESENDILERVERLVKMVNTPLLVGAPREDPDRTHVYYNSAVLLAPDGSVIARYDKLHLVPFGEYIPFKKALSFVEKFAPIPIGDFTEGNDYTVFKFGVAREGKGGNLSWRSTKNIKFSCLICFEDIFAGLARQFVLHGANFLVNITNDAWFGRSSAAYQHAQNSVFRAVENRVNVIRAANTGLSCFIDQKGRIYGVVKGGGEPLFVDGIQSDEIILTKTMTFYTRYGDVFAYVCIIFSVLCMIPCIRSYLNKDRLTT